MLWRHRRLRLLEFPFRCFSGSATTFRRRFRLRSVPTRHLLTSSSRLSFHPCATSSCCPSCRAHCRSSCRHRIPCSQWPTHVFQLPSSKRHYLRSLPRCVRLCVSVCPCNLICHL